MGKEPGVLALPCANAGAWRLAALAALPRFLLREPAAAASYRSQIHGVPDLRPARCSARSSLTATNWPECVNTISYPLSSTSLTLAGRMATSKMISGAAIPHLDSIGPFRLKKNQ